VSWTVSALRWAFSWSLGAAVLAEYLGGLHGLGVMIASAQSRLDATEAMAGLVVVSLLAVAGDRALVLVQSRLTQWRSS
jgi:ABC-type nitrate/sulfonate/bicarbonate transport system permease component